MGQLCDVGLPPDYLLVRSLSDPLTNGRYSFISSVDDSSGLLRGATCLTSGTSFSTSLLWLVLRKFRPVKQVPGPL